MDSKTCLSSSAGSNNSVGFKEIIRPAITGKLYNSSRRVFISRAGHNVNFARFNKQFLSFTSDSSLHEVHETELSFGQSSTDNFTIPHFCKKILFRTCDDKRRLSSSLELVLSGLVGSPEDSLLNIFWTLRNWMAGSWRINWEKCSKDKFLHLYNVKSDIVRHVKFDVGQSVAFLKFGQLLTDKQLTCGNTCKASFSPLSDKAGVCSLSIIKPCCWSSSSVYFPFSGKSSV